MAFGGEQHPHARLTHARVVELRRRAKAGATVQELAAEVGMDWSSVYRAVTGQCWQSVDSDEPPVPVRRQRWTGAEIEQLASASDATAREVAEQLGRSPLAVRLQRHRLQL
jgi:hypothetical protein